MTAVEQGTRREVPLASLIVHGGCGNVPPELVTTRPRGVDQAAAAAGGAVLAAGGSACNTPAMPTAKA